MKLRNILLSLGLAVAGENAAAATPAAASAEPDFAHPRKVLAQANAILDRTAGDPAAGPQRVRAVLEICTAAESIDPDSVYSLIGRVADLADEEKSLTARSLMQLAEAKLLNNAYMRKRWVYDRLDTPDTPVPTDITEWNGRQFRSGIQARATQALDGALAHNAPLADYAGAVQADKRTLLYFPQVADFVACDAVQLLAATGLSNEAKALVARMKAAQTAGSAPYYYWLSRELGFLPYEERYDATLAAYREHSHDEYARMLLDDACSLFYGKDERRRPLIALVDESLERFPRYWNNTSLRNRLQQLRQGRNLVSYPLLVCPGRSFDVDIKAEFAHSAGFRIYQTPSAPTADGSRRFIFAALSRVGGSEYADPDSLERIERSCPVTLPRPGVYLLNAGIDGQYGRETYGLRNSIVCTPYVPVALSECDEQIVVMAGFADGRPAEGVRVLAAASSKAPTTVGTTDSNGLARFKLPTPSSYTVSALTPDGERLSFADRVSVHADGRGFSPASEPHPLLQIYVLPARPIYHFGDTLRWAVMADLISDDGKSRLAAKNKELTVELLDANSERVDSTTVRTDGFGRASGEFALPADGLGGRFVILAYTAVGSEARDFASRNSVTVSDYRMPTFEVTDLSVVRDKPARGDVSVSGRAVTFAGMPVAGARVDITIQEAWRWRWWMPGMRLGSLNVLTDGSGRFTATVSAEFLGKSSGHDFAADISVTAAAGENATARKPFTNGRPYFIMVGGETFLSAETRTKLPLHVYDADGKEADIMLKWTLATLDGSRTVASGKCAASSPVADLDRVHGGEYRLTVEAADPALADAGESTFLVYNVALASLPEGYPLLVDCSETKTNDAGRASFRYGVAHDDTWLYAALCVDRSIVEVEVQKRDKGFRHLSLDLPEGSDFGRLYLFTVRDGKVCSFSVDIHRPERRTLTISGESFRDRLTPGSEEHWQLKVSDAGGRPAEAAMVATMYNHALDALASLYWTESFPLRSPWPALILNMPADGRYTANRTTDVTHRSAPGLQRPAFRFLSGPFDGIRIRGSRMLANTAKGIETAEAESEEVVSLSAAAPQAKMMAMADSDGAVLEESAVTTGGADDDAAQPQRFEYRDADVAEAFWMPELSATPDGSLHMDFRLPDANTTWRLQALAWTESMEAGSLLRDFVANKPVMVQPNLPRFLRAGDKARILATVYNNDSETRVLSTAVELFDPATMRVLATAESSDTVAAGASAIVAIDVEAPSDAASLGYRVRSASPVFADGEQTVIPIESAQCDVVESQPFYLNPGDKEVKIRIPDDPSGSYTLLYCQNPSWSVVKALPGLVEYDPTTAPGASHALFAACTAKGIVERTPAVADALRAWKEQPLSSRLATNDAVRIATLRATPWVQAAESDSARMARLALLLDADETEGRIRSAIAVLASLADKNGGLRWGKWSEEPSLWPTLYALHTMGLLRLAGYMPADVRLREIMVRALAYADRELQSLDRDKRHDPDMSYAVVRSLWKDVAPSAWGKRVIDNTLAYCGKNWRTASTSGKADMAILLDIYGRSARAREILGSVSEFAVPTADKGVSFPSVDNIGSYAPLLMAFGRIEPASALIDGMRQWLVVREQSTVGFGATDATQLVGAFLNSGTPWHTDNTPADIHLGHRPVDTGSACSYGGEATVQLGAAAAGKTLRIAPKASVPSFGAVVSRYRSLPADVKAASCEAISIEKRMVIVKAGEGAAFAPADSVSLGDRVRVLLTLHVDRDMEYVTVIDERAAGLEPVDQTPGMTQSAGAVFYRETRDASTRLFIGRLPKGTYQLSYDCTANTAGSFAAGLATVQSALAPALTAHSAGSLLVID